MTAETAAAFLGGMVACLAIQALFCILFVWLVDRGSSDIGGMD